MALDPRIIPTPERTIVLAQHIPVGTFGAQRTMSPIILRNKQAGDVLDWWIDLTTILAAGTDDRITEVRATVAPTGTAGDMVVSDSAVSGSWIGIILAAGRDSITYAVTLEASTDTGRVLTFGLTQRVAGTGVSPGAGSSWTFAEPTGIRVKRGATLILQLTVTDDNNVPIDITNMTLSAQARTVLGAKVADLPVSHTDELSIALIEAPTDSWPIGTLLCDLRAMSGEIVEYSATFQISVDRPVTT